MTSAVQPEVLEERSTDLVVRARSLEVTDQHGYDAAVELAQAVKALRDEAEAHHRPVIEAAHRAHKAALAALQRIDGPLKDAEQTLKAKIGAFVAEQERLRLEAERKAREEAERLRLEAFEREIEALESNGATPTEIAAVIAEAEAEVPVVIAPKIAPTYTKAGVAARTNYCADVTDMKALVRYVHEHPEHIGLLEPNYKLLNSMARNLGRKLSIPGVSVLETKGVAISRRLV